MVAAGAPRRKPGRRPDANGIPLVAEVISPGKRKAEILHKIQAYIDSGVQEVLIIARNGKVTYYGKDGLHPDSAMAIRLELPPELFAR